MKRFIKPAMPSENGWKCTKCGLYFTLYGPAKCYITPNYCPNCGTPYADGTPTAFTKFEDEEYVYQSNKN